MDENKNMMDEEKNKVPSTESETTSGKNDKMLPISILIAAVLVSGSLLFSSLYKPAPAPAAPGGDTGAQTGPSAADLAKALTLDSRDAVLGNVNAPVTLVEYGDYQCPFCVQFFSQTQPQIVQGYVNAGKVKMVFRNFPFLGDESYAAAQAAECSEDQNKFWAYHDALYAAKYGDEQKQGGENDGFFTRALFLKLAAQVGLDIPSFTTCIDSNKYQNAVTQEKTQAGTAGVNSTPTFFANTTQILGAQPYANFQQAIEAVLSK